MSKLLFNGLEKFEQILKKAFEREYLVTDQTYIEIDHIHLNYLGEDTVDKPYIELSFRFGYKFMTDLMHKSATIMFENTDSFDYIEGLATQAIRNLEDS